ncbi:MAG TPA: fumarylacetoacetate hydrolase family protein [Dehalococcoidia bacterium]
MPNVQMLEVSPGVNGVQKQRSNARDMIFGVARLVGEWPSAGDSLRTGTPARVRSGNQWPRATASPTASLSPPQRGRR